jgi:hypothetical protein
MRRLSVLLHFLAAGSVLLANCGTPAETPRAWLSDATRASGVEFRPAVEHERGAWTPEILGSGAALLDADGDGDLDMFLANAPPSDAEHAASDAFFAQVAPLVFEDATARGGFGGPGGGTGAAAGDVDGDGDLDLFVASVGPDRLFRNRGQAVFDEVAAQAGTEGPGWSSSAAFADLDGDGDLDLFVARYLDLDRRRRCRDAAGRTEYCGPTDYPGLTDLLYENQGDGRFRDASAELGITGVARRGLGVLAADLDEDGRLDVLVANDNDPNQLWMRGDDGRYQDVALERGVAYDAGGREQAGMGIACANLEGSGLDALLLSHLTGEGTTLFAEGPPGSFRDRTRERGLLAPTLPFTGFGIAVLDLDDDRAPEILQLNGGVTRGATLPGSQPLGSLAPYAQRGLLLRLDAARARSAPELAGPLDEPTVGRALCVGDLDGDGDDDVVTTAVGGSARLLRNDAPRNGRALRVRARFHGVDALGASVRALRAAPAEQTPVVLQGRVPSGGSYLASSEPVCRISLGDLDAVEELEVTWPDGTRERFPGAPAGSAVTLVHGSGRALQR